MSNSELANLFAVCEAENSSISIDDAIALEALIRAVRTTPSITSLFGETVNGKTLLSLCCGSGKTNCAIFVLNYAPESASTRFSRGMFSLHWAAGTGDLKLVQAVYEAYPLALNEPTDGGNTPLYFAVDSEAVEVVEYLLTKGAFLPESVLSHCAPSEFDSEYSTRVREIISSV
jgi:hypothetical protein